MLTMHTTKGRGGIGGCGTKSERNPMKRSRLRRVGKKAKKNSPAYVGVREFTKEAYWKTEGTVSGDGKSTIVPCACGCGTRCRIDEMEPHHIDGRHGQEPGTLNNLWRPTNIAWVTSKCHDDITNNRVQVEWFNITPEAKSLEVAVTLWLNHRYPLAGSMKWSDEVQAEAIMAVLKIGETCEECGMDECQDSGEGPEE